MPIADTIGAVKDLITAGKVRHGGVSKFTMDMVDQAQAALNTPLVANQIELHPRIDKARMIAHLVSKGIPVEAYSPLAQGKVMENVTLREIAAAHDASPALVALAWILTCPLNIALPGTSNQSRLAGKGHGRYIQPRCVDPEIARIPYSDPTRPSIVGKRTRADGHLTAKSRPSQILRVPCS